MAGGSITPLAKKLGLKPGQRLALIGAPSGWGEENIPRDVMVVSRRSKGRVDIIIAFFANWSTLDASVETFVPRVPANGAVWIAWPRRAGGHASDITDNEVRRIIVPLGLVDVKVAALGDEWSGLKFVWRKELRASLE